MGWWGNMLYRHASWSVGGAATWLSVDGHDDDYEYAGSTVWSTFTFSFAKPGTKNGGAADGKTIHNLFDVHDNGRGPGAEVTMRLLPDKNALASLTSSA